MACGLCHRLECCALEVMWRCMTERTVVCTCLIQRASFRPPSGTALCPPVTLAPCLTTSLVHTQHKHTLPQHHTPPHTSNYFVPVQRDVLCRVLRPELVLSQHMPLCSDAATSWSPDAAAEHRDEVSMPFPLAFTPLHTPHTHALPCCSVTPTPRLRQQ